MAFGARETSQDLGEPIQLYLFRYGPDPDHIYAYTNAERDKSFEVVPGQSVSFKAVSIESGEITSSGTLDNQQLTIAFPETLELYALFKDRPPSAVVTCIIWRGHESDPDQEFLVEWSGRVVGFSDASYEVSLTCDPVATMMLRNALRRHWQYGCPHPLYSQGPGLCNANRANATAQFIVSSVVGSTLTIDLAATVAEFGSSAKYTAFADTAKQDFYLGGLMEFVGADGQRAKRTIIKRTGDGVFRLANAMAGILPGATVSLVFGCNHKTGIPSLNDGGHCGPVHNNIQNYGGDPWIPLKNPIGLHNIYR